MPNYKGIYKDRIDIGGFQHIMQGNDVLVRIKSSAITVNKSWHNQKDNSNYVVPSGKKAKIIYIEQLDPATTSVLSSTTSVDSAAGAVTILSPAHTVPWTNVIFISEYMLAGTYFTTTVGALGVDDGRIYLLEVDV